jgi:predicted nuclease of restriction endonuclease-like RecB superfamily
MPLLQVRECPEDIYKKITIVAKSENRSIAQQVIVLLEKGLGQEQSNVERRRKLLERIESREIDSKAKEIDIVAMIREDRER